jgi:hypothetical protein
VAVSFFSSGEGVSVMVLDLWLLAWRAANRRKLEGRARAGRPGAAKHREAAFASIAVANARFGSRSPPDDV